MRLRKAAVLLWVGSAALLVAILRGRWGGRLRRADMLVRIPGAVFFLVLLATHGADQIALIAWTLAFVPPYLALTPWRERSISRLASNPS